MQNRGGKISDANPTAPESDLSRFVVSQVSDEPYKRIIISTHYSQTLLGRITVKSILMIYKANIIIMSCNVTPKTRYISNIQMFITCIPKQR